MYSYPVIILVDPQIGENIGATARAMLNFGLQELRLVNPREGSNCIDSKAVAMSVGATIVLDNAKIFQSIEDAVQDCTHVYATTARMRYKSPPKKDVREAMTSACQTCLNHKGAKVGILFGCERSGLENYDISLSQGIITIPTNPDFSSLNLAQSVVLVCYEWFRAQNQDLIRDEAKTSENMDLQASQESLNKIKDNFLEDAEEYCLHHDIGNMLEYLISRLDEASFFAPHPDPERERKMRLVENMFRWHLFSKKEIFALWGIFRFLSGDISSRNKSLPEDIQ